MLQRLKDFFTNPYAAPLTQPIKSVARWTYVPIRNFCEAVKYGLDSTDDKPVYLRVFDALRNDDAFYANDGTQVMTWAGVVGGGLAAAGGAGFGAHLAGLGWLGVSAAGIAATSIGMMAGPFIVAGAVAAVAGVAGVAIAAVPAFFEGLYMANKHRKGIKAQAAAVQAVPQLKAATPDMQQQAAGMLKDIRTMPPEAQAPLLKALNEQYRAGKLGDADGVFKAIEALPEADRQTLVKSLQVTMKDAFEAVAVQESDAAMQLHTPVKTGGPLKFKSTGASA